MYVDSSGTNTGVGPVEKQAYNEKDRHPASRCDEPQRKNSLGPTRAPGNCWPTIRQAIGNATVWIQGFFAAHGSGLS